MIKPDVKSINPIITNTLYKFEIQINHSQQPIPVHISSDISIISNTSNTPIYVSIMVDNYYLSVHPTDNIVDLYYKDDNSGRQKWIMESDSIVLYGGRNDLLKYLGVVDDKLYLFYNECKYTKYTLSNNVISFNRHMSPVPIYNSYISSLKPSILTLPINIEDFKFEYIPYIPYNLPQNIIINNYYLSVHPTDNKVDLYYTDDNSGRQKWILKLITINTCIDDSDNKSDISDLSDTSLDFNYVVKNSFNFTFQLILYGGRSDNKKYINYVNNKFVLYNSGDFSIWKMINNIPQPISSSASASTSTSVPSISTSTHIHMPYISSSTSTSTSTSTSSSSNKVALLLRGHVRNGFDNSHIRDFVIDLKRKYDVTLFVHTWNVKEANKSWRKLTIEKLPIKKEYILNYFGDLLDERNLIIDSDSDLKTKLTGVVRHKKWVSSLPLVLWKYMWWGINRGIDMINSNGIKYNAVLNTRLDIFNVPMNNLDFSQRSKYIDMVGVALTTKCDIKFVTPHNGIGIDNYYVGSQESITKLIKEFNFNLDNILPNIDPYQEKTVYNVANNIFDNIL